MKSSQSSPSKPAFRTSLVEHLEDRRLMSSDVGAIFGSLLSDPHAHGGVESASGDLIFGDAVNADHGLVLHGGGDLVFEDGLVVKGDLVLTNATSVTFKGNVEVTGKIIIDATGSIVVGEHLTAGGTVSLTSDEVDFLGGANSVAATGDLTIKTHTSGFATQVGFTSDALDSLGLTDTDLAALQVGGKIVIGGSGSVVVDSAEFQNDVSISGSDISVQDSLLAGGMHVALAAGGIVRNDGLINVSATTLGGSAGSLILTGKYVGNFGTIQAQGSASTLGGSVKMISSIQTVVGSAGLIDASGGTSGGSIYLWSDTNTTMAGHLAAKGGAAGGDGGFVEVSSAGGFSLTGTVDTTAVHGKTGMLLLDPKNVIIAAAGGGAIGGVDNFSDTQSSDVTIAASTITAAASSVTIQANNDITVNAVLNMSQDLTLLAGRSVIINNNITLANKTLTIIANDDAGIDAYRDAGSANITTLSGVTLSAGSGTINLTLENGDVDVAGGITVDKVVTTGTLNITTAGFVRETAGDAAPTNGAMSSDDDLTAGTLNFIVTSTDASAGEALDQGNGALEIAAGTVNASVSLSGGLTSADYMGYLILADADHTTTPLTLGSFNAGGGSVTLISKGGSITGTAGATPNLVATQVNLITEKFSGPDLDGNNQPVPHYGSIGTQSQALRTNVSMLTATSADGGIYINEADTVMINKLSAQDQGSTAQTGSNGTVVVNPTGSSTIAGTSDIVINAGGDIVVLEVKAADQVTLNATGSILDGNQDSSNVLARGLNLTAGGSIGNASDALDTSVMTLQASAANGGVFVNETDGVNISTITAAGTGNDVVINNAGGSLVLGSITATGGNVTVKSAFDSITDGNGSAMNIAAATATLEARTAIGGTGEGQIELNVGGISTKVANVGGATYVANSGTTTALAIETNNGAVNIGLTGGSLAFVQPGSGNQLSLSAPSVSTFSFSNTGGSIAVNTINAGTGSVNLTAKTFIADYANDTTLNLTAGSATLKAGTYIGAEGNRLETDVNSLTATADAGGIYISDIGSITSLTATAKGAGNDVMVSTAGDLSVARVTAPDIVNLDAGGEIRRIGSVMNVGAASATIHAGGSIGTSAEALTLDVRTLTAATADAGGVFLKAKGTMTATSVIAAGGDVEILADNDLTLGSIETDAAHTVKLTSTYGGLVDGNGVAVNITGGSANLNAVRIGTSIDAIDTDLGTVTAMANSGGVFLNELNDITVTKLEAQGLGSNISLTAGGDITLSVVKAEGDTVNIKSTGGAIKDGNGSALNITANQLDINAAHGIGALQNSVNRLGSANGGSAGVTISNIGAIAITDATLEGRGSSKLTIEADSITVLDMTDDQATLDNNGSLQLTARTGNIVFLDSKDMIVASGTGTIGITAGLGVTPSYPDTGAVAVIGNLKTAGGSIDVRANHHVTIGLLDTGGNGDVTVVSETGVIIDGNGSATNIIGKVVTLSGALPSTRVAQLESSIRTADYSAMRSEAAAKLTNAQSLAAATAIMNVQQANALSAKNNATSVRDEASSDKDSKDTAALASYIVATALDGVATALGIARDVVAIPAGAAQAIPFTGDGGAMTGYSALDVAANVADVAAYAAGVVADQLGDIAEEAANTLAQNEAELTALTATFEDSLATWKAFDEATSIATKAAEAAAIARDASLKVRDQAITAEDQANVIGTIANPLGIQAQELNATAADGSLFLAVTGDLNLGGISANGVKGEVFIQATGDIYVTGSTIAPTQVSLAAGGSILDGGGTIQAPKFLAVAQNSVGTELNPIHTMTDSFAAHAVTGSVGINNAGVLEVGTIRGVSGILAGGAVAVTSSDSLTLKDSISATGQTVTLTSQNGSIIDAHTGSPDVTAFTLHATSASGIQLDTAVTNLTAQNTGAGSITIDEADGLNLDNVQTTDGDISINAGGAVQAGAVTAAGDVTLHASGTLSMLNGGRITAGDLTATAGGDVNVTTTVQSADVSVTGSGDLTIAESDALQVDHLSTLNGAIDLTTGGQITLAEGAMTAGAGLGNVTIHAAGSISGPLTGNGSREILGAIVNIVTTGANSQIGGGLTNPLEIDATSRLDISTQDSNIFIDDTAGGMVIGTANVGLGGFFVKAVSGSITAAKGGDGVADIVASHVNLHVTGATSHIGGGESSQVEFDSNTVLALTAGGNAYLTDTAGGVAVYSLDAGTGDVHLTAKVGAITDAWANGTNNVVANKLMLSATAGVGTSTNAINATVTAFEGFGGTGGVHLNDLSGGLTIGGVTSALNGVSATSGNIVVTATDTAATGDNLTVNEDVTASNGSVTLRGGDNVTVAQGTTVSASTSVAITGDHGDADSGTGSTVTLNGAIRANSLQITTGNDADTVVVKDAVVSSVAINTNGGNDAVTLTAGNTLGTGTVDLGADNDQLTLFTAVQNVSGNDGDDTVTLKSGASITGTLAGGNGSDKLIYDHDGVGGDDYTGQITLNLQAQSSTSVAAFSGLERVEASSHANDRVIGANTASTWHITGSNAGDIGGASTFSFSGFENLTGGSADDAFQFAAGGSISGNLDGGASTGRDSINYDGSNFNAAVTVALDVNDGGVTTAIGGRFDHIEEVIGDADFTSTNSLTGGGSNNVWAFTGLHAGNISNQFFFQKFGRTAGGTADDNFSFANNTLPLQPVHGGDGNNTLDLSAWTSDLVWNITGDGSGTVVTTLGTFEFSGMDTLIGGSGNDRFVFSDDKTVGQGLIVPGTIRGSGGNDFIDMSAYTTANVWTRTGQDGTITTGRGAWNYSSIEQFLGSKTTTFQFNVIDFTGSITKVNLPAQFLPTQTGSVSVTLTNLGNDNALARRMDVSFYLSLDGTLDGSDILIGKDANRSINLLPGEHYPVFTTNTQVPLGTAPGQYHVLAWIDSGNATAEGDETNNVIDGGVFEVLPIEVDLKPEITSSTLPSQILPGSKGVVTTVLTNLGNSVAKGKVDVEYFLSQDGTIDAGDIALGGIYNTTLSLAGGASKTFTFNAQVPAGAAAGDYQILVRVDGQNQILESNETNNIAASGSTVQLSTPFTDLVPDFQTATLPSIGIPNDVLNFVVPIKNLGNVPATGKMDVKFYLSLDGTVSPGTDILLKTLNNVSVSVGPDGQQIIKTSAAIPTSAQNGTYFVLADIDASNTIGESNNSNNTAVLSDGLEVVWRFGNFANRENVKLTVPDANGNLVTFSMNGQGVGNVQGGSNFSEITLTGTDEATTVNISTKGNVYTDVHGIRSTNAISTFNAGKVNLLGDLSIGGSAHIITLGNVSGGQHNFTVGTATNPFGTLGLKFASVEDLNITSGTAIRTLAVNDWQDTDATQDTIQAPWLGAVTSSRDFQADIVATGANAGVSLSSLAVKGASNSDLTLAGGALKLTMGEWADGALSATFAKSIAINGDLSNSLLNLSGSGLVAKQQALGSLAVKGLVANSVINVQQNAGTIQVGTWGGGSTLAVGLGDGGDGTFFDGNEVALGGTLDRFTAKAFETANGSASFGIAVDNLKQVIQLDRSTKFTAATLPYVNSDLRLVII